MSDMDLLKNHPIFFSRLGAPWSPSLYDPEGNPYYGYDREQIETLQRYHRDFAAAGVHTHSILLDSGWRDADRFDYRVTDQQLAQLLKADPEGYILPRIKLDAPLDWCRRYPEELFVYANGRGLRREEIAALVGTPSQDFWRYNVPKWYEKYEDFCKKSPLLIDLQSLSSLRWQKDAATALLHLLEHLENGPFADRIAGYHLAFGHTGECMHWREENYLNHGDYGIAHLQRFYDYGLRKYDSHERLAVAWQQPTLTRDTVELPSPAQRYGEGDTLSSYFRGRPQDVIARDFDCFLSQNVADAILHFAKSAKTVTKKPIGFFYGYFLFAGDIPYEGHLQLDRVLSSPDVDFLASPTAYHRRAGASPSMEMTVTQSVNREKLYFEEIDARTYIVPPERAGVKPQECTKSFPETRYVLWRSLCKNLSHGSAFWWMDLGRGWFDSPDIMAEFAALTNAHAALQQGEHRSVADVLVVMDDAALVSTQFNRLFTHGYVRDLVLSTRSSGVLCDMYRTSDLDKIDLSRYRLIVFGTNYDLTPERLASFGFCEDATLMFYGCVGILRDGLPSVAHTEELTGFSLAEAFDEERRCPVLRITEGDDPTLCEKWVNGRRHVMCTEPSLAPATFREIARSAGCHIFVDEDCILFGDSAFLAAFAKQETHTVLHLKERKSGKEWISGAPFDAQTIPLELAENAFVILQYAPFGK